MGPMILIFKEISYHIAKYSIITESGIVIYDVYRVKTTLINLSCTVYIVDVVVPRENVFLSHGHCEFTLLTG